MQIENGDHIGAGFNTLIPGMHDLTVTLQAKGNGNQLTYSYWSDTTGTVIWTPFDISTQQFEHTYTAYGVYADDVAMPTFDALALLPGPNGETVCSVGISHVDADVGFGYGGGCQTPATDETEAITGSGIPVTDPGPTLPATFPGTGMTGIPVWLGIETEQTGVLNFNITGTGAAVYKYDIATFQWAKITAPIPVSLALYETYMIHTCDTFIAAVSIETQFVPNNGPLQSADTVKVFLQDDPIDLAIDSNNDETIDAADEAIEDDVTKPGKIIFVNHDDDDADGIPDYADLNIADEEFVPLKLKITGITDWSNVTVRFTFDTAIPTASQFNGVDIGGGYKNYTAVKIGTLRMWNISAPGAARTVSDLIQSNVAYAAADLGFSASAAEVTLYLEGMNSGQTDISVTVAQNGLPYGCGDLVRTSVTEPNLGFNHANDNNDTNNLHNGVPDVNFDINSYDEIIEDQLEGFKWWWRSTRAEATGIDVTDQTLLDAVPFIVDIPQLLIDQGYTFHLSAPGFNGDEIRIYPNQSSGGDGGGRLEYFNSQAVAGAQIATLPMIILTDSTPKEITVVAGRNEFVALFKKPGGLPKFDGQIALRMARDSGLKVKRDTIKAMVAHIKTFWAEYNCRNGAMRTAPNYPLDGVGAATRYAKHANSSEMTVFPKAVHTAGTQVVNSLKHKHYFIFLHGYNVSEARARVYNNILFRRIYLGLGFRGQYLGFIWKGDKLAAPAWLQSLTPVNIPTFFDPNVLAALQTGVPLSEFIIEKVRPWASDSTDKIWIMAHSLGNLVTWEAARIQEREYLNDPNPDKKMAKHFMKVEAAVWKEAFHAEVPIVYPPDIIGLNGITYSVDELEKHSWAFWFNQTGHNSSSMFGNIHHSYVDDDFALVTAMRLNDWAARGLANQSNGGVFSTHYYRILSLTAAIPPVINVFYRSTVHQSVWNLFPPAILLYHPHQLHRVPTLMKGPRFPIGYRHTDLNEPIGAVPKAGWDNFNARAPATGWRSKKHSDAWILPYMKEAGRPNFIREWYQQFVKGKGKLPFNLN